MTMEERRKAGSFIDIIEKGYKPENYPDNPDEVLDNLLKEIQKIDIKSSDYLKYMNEFRHKIGTFSYTSPYKYEVFTNLALYYGPKIIYPKDFKFIKEVNEYFGEELIAYWSTRNINSNQYSDKITPEIEKEIHNLFEGYLKEVGCSDGKCKETSPFEYIMEITEQNDKIPKGTYYIESNYITNSDVYLYYWIFIHDYKGDVVYNLRAMKDSIDNNENTFYIYDTFKSSKNIMQDSKGALECSSQCIKDNKLSLNGKIMLIDSGKTIGSIKENSQNLAPKDNNPPFLNGYMYGKADILFGLSSFLEENENGDLVFNKEMMALYIDTEPDSKLEISCNNINIPLEKAKKSFMISTGRSFSFTPPECFNKDVNTINIISTDLSGNTAKKDIILDFIPKIIDSNNIKVYLYGKLSQKDLNRANAAVIANRMNELNELIKDPQQKMNRLIISSIDMNTCNGAFDGQRKLFVNYYCFNYDINQVLSVTNHEMAHAIYTKWKSGASTEEKENWYKIFNDYRKIYDHFFVMNKGLEIDLMKDYNFVGTICGINPGHPKDNEDELHSSAFIAYYKYGDKFANLIKSVKNPSLREKPFKSILEDVEKNDKTKLNDIEKNLKDMWVWMRDKRFDGKVFTSDGKDPFAS